MLVARALRLPAVAVIAASLAFGAFTAGNAVSSARMKGPSAVGIVDLERLFTMLKEIDDVNKANEAKVVPLKKEIDGLKASYDSLGKELEAINATDGHAKLEKYIQAQEAKTILDTKVKMTQTRLAIERGQFLRPMYKKIQDACAKLAADQQLDLILLDDRAKAIPDDPSLSDTQVIQVIKDKLILFAGKSVDITDSLKDMLNNEYQAGKR